MSCFTFAPMRAALPRVATPARPQKLQLPAFSGLKLARGIPAQPAGAQAVAMCGSAGWGAFTMPPPSFFARALPRLTLLCLSLVAAETSSSSSLDAPQNGGKVFAMRHGNRTARLGRPADQRKALIRGLVTEVLRHGKIKTTKVRAAGVLGRA